MSNARNLSNLLGTSATVPSGNLPSGSIIQVATDTSGTNTAITGNTYTASSVSITFTPKKSNSTILLMWSGNVSQQTHGANGFGLAFFEGNTQLNTQPADGTGPFTEYKDETRIFSYITMSHSMSASSTSARTYTIRGRKYNSSVSDLNIGVGSSVVGTQSFTVMEISG